MSLISDIKTLEELNSKNQLNDKENDKFNKLKNIKYSKNNFVFEYYIAKINDLIKSIDGNVNDSYKNKVTELAVEIRKEFEGIIKRYLKLNNENIKISKDNVTNLLKLIKKDKKENIDYILNSHKELVNENLHHNNNKTDYQKLFEKSIQYKNFLNNIFDEIKNKVK
ncbi:UNVERIFIED_CONTAM: hypothetical protein O8I53_08300 [Campylobacter lari]